MATEHTILTGTSIDREVLASEQYNPSLGRDPLPPTEKKETTEARTDEATVRVPMARMEAAMRVEAARRGVEADRGTMAAEDDPVVLLGWDLSISKSQRK